MRRVYWNRSVPLVLAGASLALAACGQGNQQASTPETVVVVSEVPATSVPETTPPPETTTAAPPTTVIVIQAPESTPETVPGYVTPPAYDNVSPISIPSWVEPGTYCRWLATNGYSADEAAATFASLGRPSHMDADKNGIPCETVY